MPESEYRFDDIPDDRKKFSPDRKFALYQYAMSHHEDAYDNDTRYAIVVWNVANKQELRVIYKSCKESYYLDTHDPDIASVGFSENSKAVVIKYDNGKEERVPVLKR